jgi:inner membrane protein
MITRHHISLAIGSIVILYFPLISTNPAVLAAIATGVCTGVVIPDIQMKKPRHFKALYFAWLLIQIFKRSILSLHLLLYRKVLDLHLVADDKRLTHSLPGLFFLAGMIGCSILFVMREFPFNSPLYYLRIFLAGIIIGLILHFLEDTCTKKGLCLFYPFNETYRISGSIRPCNKNDSRIRLFHFQLMVVIIAMILFYCTGLCPEYLKWPVSIIAIGICTIFMLYHAEVRINSANPAESVKFSDVSG